MPGVPPKLSVTAHDAKERPAPPSNVSAAPNHPSATTSGSMSDTHRSQKA